MGKGGVIQIRPRGSCPSCGERYHEKIWKDDMDGKKRSTGRGVCNNPDCFDSALPKAWYLDFFYGGKRLKVYSDSSGQVIDTQTRAARLRDKIKFEMEDGRFDPANYVKAEAGKYWISTLLDQFLRTKSKELAPSYYPQYVTMCGREKKFFGSKDIKTIRKIDLVNYKNHIEEKYKLSPKSVKNYLDHFRAFLNWCCRELEILKIVPSMPQIQVPETEIKWLGPEDQRKVIEAVPDADKPMIAFLMLHGCRPSEARALKVRDVNLNTESIRIAATFSRRIYRDRRKGRGAKAVVIPIHPEMVGYIRERVKSALPGAWLFVNQKNGEYYSENKLKRIWERVKAETGIKGLRLYDASRHSYASQLVSAGVPIYDVSKLLGHSEVRTTERYAHMDLASMRQKITKVSLLTTKPTGHDVDTEVNQAKNG
jgi:integrase